MRHTVYGLATASLALLAISAAPAYAGSACTSMNGTGPTNDWATGNWSSGAPNSTTSACITNGTAGTPTGVQVSGGQAVLNLQVDANNSLTISNGASLSVYGSSIILNGSGATAGSLSLSGSGGSTSMFLQNTASPTSLSGGGTLTLSNTTPTNTYIYGLGGAILDNAADTIQGAGQIGDGYTIKLTNESLVNANSSGQALILNGGNGVTNTGTLTASSGGILELQGTVNNNPNSTVTGGTISTDSGNGSIVYLMNTSTVQGGTLTGNIQTNTGAAILDGTANQINNAATITVNGSTGLYLEGTINNTGSIAVTGTGGGTYLYLNGNTTLTGGGTVTLSNTNPTSTYIYGAGTNSLDNKNNTIQGYGEIGASYGISVTNESGGLIQANVGGQTLTLDAGGGITNYGTLTAINGGALAIVGTVNNNPGNTLTGGTISTDSGNGSVVYLTNDSTVQGGTLIGNIQTQSGAAILDGTVNQINNTGTVTVNDSTGLYLEGTINNTGAINVTGTGGSTYVYLEGNTTLTGGGTVTLSNPTQLNTYLYGGGANNLDNKNNTIQGYGQIGDHFGITVTNESGGTIQANVSGKVLTLDVAGGLSNAGTLQAINGGILQLEYTINNNPNNTTAGGTIGTDSGNGSVVQLLNGSKIQGGTLAGNFTTTTGTATLDGASAPGQINNTGTITVADSTGLYLQGTINNTGSIAVNGQGGSTYVYLNQNTTLTGGGTLTLSNTTPANTYIYGAGGSVLENVNNTLQGFGHIGDNFGISVLNDAGGTLLANVAGRTLFIDAAGNSTTAGLTNNGTMQANAGSTLHALYGFANFNSTNGTLTGGTYNAYGGGTAGTAGTIQIDALGTTGDEIVTNAATILLSGSNSNFLDGAGLNALNLASNSGSFSILDGRNYSAAESFRNSGFVDIGSTDQFSTDGSDPRGQYSQTGGTTMDDGTLLSAVTDITGGVFEGVGVVDNELVLNGGTLAPGDPPGTLTIDGTFGMNTGDLLIGLAGTSLGDFDVLDVNGTAALGGTLEFDLQNGFNVAAGDTFFFLDSELLDGTFDAVDLSGLDLAPGLTATIDYSPAGSPNDVELIINGSTSPTPEPSTWLLFAGGLGLLAAFQIRRKRPAGSVRRRS